MLEDGLSIAMIDAARKLALIVDESDRIVTVLKLRNSDRRRSPKSAPRANARFVGRGR
jgi:hypothetical protein